MRDMLENLFKSAAALMATPVAIVADVIAIIPDAVNEKNPFSRTSDMLEAVGDNFKKVVDSK